MFCDVGSGDFFFFFLLLCELLPAWSNIELKRWIEDGFGVADVELNQENKNG